MELPREIVWDYAHAPAGMEWRLQRIAEFFPHFGRERGTVEALYRNCDQLRIPPETRDLIALYARAFGVTRVP